jgi:glycosyltransferase involved in cell wall biosynthesis
MTLDVLIPTYNRATLLRRTLDSLLAAEHPASMPFAVTVADNRSTDDTASVVRSYHDRFGDRLRYVYEPTPGRSAALNTAIASSSGELVSMIDDDEEVDRTWLCRIEQAFRDPATDFIGGPYVPRWTTTPPDWLPAGYGAVIGRVDSGSEVQKYGPGFDGMLMGGNAVIRRRVLTRVGPYRTDLGRSATRLMSCEDEDMFTRLLAAGAQGFYLPDLIIHHYVAPERVTKTYFRRWCFWRGVSLGILDRRQLQHVTYVLGIPRYLIGIAVRAAAANARGLVAGQTPAVRFANELAWWDLAGFVYGRHWERRRNLGKERQDALPAAPRNSVA